MSAPRAVNSSWYVIYTHAKQEARAANNLAAWGLETFFPRIREGRGLTHKSASPIIKPLFPRYVFARFDANVLYQKVCFTRGVHSVVNFGGMPAAVDDEIIRLIESQLGPDGFVNLCEEFKPNERVIIKGGPLKNLVGIFLKEVNESRRVAVLLDAVSYQGRLIIEKEYVQRLSPQYAYALKTNS
ncbi:MAG TPA: transcription termination/antitermination NusG family protein [Pyrinomonadaceae bacterium]|nr:transcription termination/antitermination NusG family protein [Pyrinomonadaceae bacterium]